MRFEPPSPLERRIADLAASQHGVVALEQLVEFGLSAAAVRYRVATGALHRVHAGVYAVRYLPLTRKGSYMAAVLACGTGSALSHRSAADLRGVRRTSRATIDVISQRRPGRRRAGIDAHTSATLLPHDIEIVDGIPCTSLARTLLDLAAVVPRRAVERTFEQAEVLQVLDARAIEEVLARAGRHRGAGILRMVLDDHALGSTLTRSELEERFLAICHDARLPRPEVNAWIALEPTGYEADFLWRAERLIAEVDGRAVHTTRHAFDHDRRRDQRFMLAGFRVVRFTWRQVEQAPRDVESTIRELLRQAA